MSLTSVHAAPALCLVAEGAAHVVVGRLGLHVVEVLVTPVDGLFGLPLYEDLQPVLRRVFCAFLLTHVLIQEDAAHVALLIVGIPVF